MYLLWKSAPSLVWSSVKSFCLLTSESYGYTANRVNVKVCVPLAFIDYHHDALGSVVATSDESGNINLNEEYQPYGEKIYQTEDTENKNEDWYTGKNYDKELDLTYFGARWYDAKQGRFLSIDPAPVTLENIHSFNRYVYANNNPYRFIDPDGNQPIAVYRASYMFGRFTITPAINFGIRLGTSGRFLSLGDALYGVLNEAEEGESNIGVVIGDKISGQLDERDWTEDEIDDLVANTDPIGSSTDNTKDSEGNRKNDPASVYGSKNGDYVVVNDRTREVVQVSDKKDPDWSPDRRINWR